MVFNLAGEVLIISSLAKNNIWVFPKGHIEKGESSYEAAERECLEEAGVKAWVSTSDSLGVSTYSYAGEDVVVEWWAGIAARLMKESQLDSSRLTRWVTPSEALGLLSFGNLRNILRRALCWEEEFEDMTSTALVVVTDHREEKTT